MDNTTVFSKTGKGLLEVKNRSNRITKDQYRVLSLVDGKANLDNLAERARMNAVALRQILTQLSDLGYIKVLVSSSASDTGLGAGAITGSYYVDDLDFSGVLGAATPKRGSVYQSAETERRQRDSQERKAAEAAATKRREEEERRKQQEAALKAKEEERARKIREDAERKAQQEALRQAQLESELKTRLESERRAKEDAAKRARAEVEAKLKEEIDRQVREAAEQKRKAEAAQLLVMEEERKRKAAEEQRQLEAQKRKEEEERKRREDEERRRREEEERVKRETEERKRKEEEERMQREEEERHRREEEARVKKEAEERKRKEEKERKRREEEERRRREEEERVKKEAEERKRKEEEERKRREEEERRRREEEARVKKEAEDRKRKEEEERKRREEEERRRREQEAYAKKEAEERKRKDEEERKRREDEERRHREEEARVKEEAEERRRLEEAERQRLAELEAAAEELRLQEEVKRHKAEKERRRQNMSATPDVDVSGHGASASPSDGDDAWMLKELARLNVADMMREGKSSDSANSPETRPGRSENPDRALETMADTTASLEVTMESDEYPAVVAELSDATAGVITTEPSHFLEQTAQDSLDVIEDVTLQDAPFTETASTIASPALRVTEEDIRQALEEQERRWRMEEEARSALERAEFEAQLKAEREAREIAEAAAKARREAEERALEEAERLRREEKERRDAEEEQLRIQKEAERRAREHARVEAERRKREDELQRQRKEIEERELRKIERERIHKEIRKGQITPARIFAGLVLILLLILGGAIQFASLSPWAPDIERIASFRLGEPVHIKSVRGHLFPFQIVLEGVTVGSAQDVRATSVTLTPQTSSLFSPNKVLDAVEIKGVTIGPEGLRRVPQWLKGGTAKVDLVDVGLIRIRDSSLSLPGLALPNINADVKLGRAAELLSMNVYTVDEHLRVELLPQNGDMDVVVSGRTFTLPVGPGLEVMDLQGSGRISGGELHMTRLDYFAYGGQGNAELRVRWQDQWSVETTFDLQRMSLESAMRALAIQVISDGALDAKGMIRLRAASFSDLFQRPEVAATFTARRGNLAGFDIPRALQHRNRDGVQGGKTRYEELTGTLSAKEGRFQYRQVKLTAGILSAAGQVDISSEGEVAGRVFAELRSSAGLVRGNFTVSGNEQAILLKP